MSIVILLFGGAFILAVGSIIVSAWRTPDSRRPLIVVGGPVAIIGAASFFGAVLSGSGGFNWLPAWVEWPVGYSDGVVTTAEGIRVVSHMPSGRVQLYDAEWRFIRGWPVDAEGGAFDIVVREHNRIEIFTARGQWHYVFDMDGALISKRMYADNEQFPNQGEAMLVPTAFWLWPLAHPAIAWSAVLIGMLLLAVGKEYTKVQPLAQSGNRT